MSENNVNGFNGIWDREHPSDQVLNIANAMNDNNGPVGNKKVKVKRTWSFIDWFISLLVFSVVQIAVTFPFLIDAIENRPLIEPTAGTEDLFAQFTTPIIVLVTSLSMYVIWIGSMWVSTYFRGAKSFKKDFKLGFKKWDALLGLGIAAGLYVILLGIQLLLTEVFKIDLAGADNGALIMGQEGIWFFIIAIGIASLLGPICEELYFRGYLMNSIFKSLDKRKKSAAKLKLTKQSAPITMGMLTFLDKHRNVLAIIVSSLIFGLFHFQGTFDVGGIFVVLVTGTLGSVFAIVTIKTGRLGPAMFGHVFYNFSTLMLAAVFAQ